jgi:hypothetical protein
MANLEEKTRDRLIVLAPSGLAFFGGSLTYFALPKSFLMLIAVLVTAGVASALLSLLPPVQQARQRMIKRRYPME